MEIDDSEHIKQIQIINEEMIQIYSSIISIIDDDESIDLLDEILQQFNILKDKSKFHDFLSLLNSISYSRMKSNHKEIINDIIIPLKDQINQSFSKNEMINIFKSNVAILLSLYENKLIDYEQLKNCHNSIIFDYFLPERIKYEGTFMPDPFWQNEMEIYYSDHLDEYYTNRKEYHSESEMAQYIRSDDIESFIDYISHTDLQLNSSVPQSLFETSIHLKFNLISLIEYAAIFGSLNIFKFLFCQLKFFPAGLLNSAVIGGDPEIIHTLEIKGYQPDLSTLSDAITYHRNDIFDYFIINYGIETDFSLLLDSISSFNFYAMNEIIISHPDYLTDIDYTNRIFSDICAIDNRILFQILFQIPDLDVNNKYEEQYTDQILFAFL